MPSSRDLLEKAIIAKAMKDPNFMANLLQDPMGFLKGLAGGKLPPGMKTQMLWFLGESGNSTRLIPQPFKLYN